MLRYECVYRTLNCRILAEFVPKIGLKICSCICTCTHITRNCTFRIQNSGRWDSWATSLPHTIHKIAKHLWKTPPYPMDPSTPYLQPNQRMLAGQMPRFPHPEPGFWPSKTMLALTPTPSARNTGMWGKPVGACKIVSFCMV